MYDKRGKALSKVNRQGQMESIGSMTKILKTFCEILTLQSPSSDPSTTLNDDDSLIDDEEQSDSDDV